MLRIWFILDVLPLAWHQHTPHIAQNEKIIIKEWNERCFNNKMHTNTHTHGWKFHIIFHLCIEMDLERQTELRRRRLRTREKMNEAKTQILIMKFLIINIYLFLYIKCMPSQVGRSSSGGRYKHTHYSDDVLLLRYNVPLSSSSSYRCRRRRHHRKYY